MRWAAALMVWMIATPIASAQLSGSSFGSSRGFGGGSSSSSSSSSSFGGGSSFGGSSSSSGESYSDRMERERQERQAAEDARRREEEERRRREEAERQRIEAERQRQLEADRALPPESRAQLSRRFGDRIEYPAAGGAVQGFSHAPEPSYGADAPGHVAAVPMASTLVTRPYRHEPNWWAGAFSGGFVFLFLLGLGAGSRAVSRANAGRRARRASGQKALGARRTPRQTCEIRRISLGFAWSERARIQRALEQMAKSYDMGSARGMHGAASEAAQLLIDALPAARYGMAQRYLETTQRAERRFFELAQDLKSRFRHDTRRGGRTDFEAKAHEGAGLVVVSFVVGATRHLGPMSPSLDRQSIAQLLHGAVRISPQELVALEVVWSPSAEMDRLSSLELETVYPELMPLDSASLGGIGCAHCGAVHAAELPSCPACGAKR